MHIDIRLPIGVLFSAIGILLLVYGALADPAIFARSLGINIDCWWGGAMLLFGALMLFIARHSLRVFRAPASGTRSAP